MRIALPDVRVRDRHRQDLGDIEALAVSVERLGLLHPIVITPDNRLIAGERRLAAFKFLKKHRGDSRGRWDEIPVTVARTLDDAIRRIEAERDENTCRKAFAPSEAVAVARDLEPLERVAAAERKRQHSGRPSQTTGKSPAVSKARAKDEVAKAVGVDRKTLAKAEAVVAAAEAEPERFGKLQEQMDRTGNVGGAFKQLGKIRQADEINAEPPPLPTGPFRVIVADPPWRYDVRAADVTHRANLPYPEMSVEAICELDVRTLAAEHAVLWLWTTNAHLRESFSVLDAWGFEPKTVLTWVKQRMGTGSWLRGQTEHCHLAIRGKPTVTLSNQTTVLMADAGEHSAKPASFYALVETLCPGSKVELFQRTPRDGWASHGNAGRA